MYNVLDVAKYFLAKETMSPKKLQKMVYYAYAWTLALLNDSFESLHFRLFGNHIEAWVHGPVIPELYQEYKSYGWKDIPKLDTYDGASFSHDVVDIIEQVWGVYGSYSANQLEMISHKEDPWINARKELPAYVSASNPISDKDIFIFFNEQARS
ncbi:Panacea domain-containing protein [Oribacterium sinus]